MKKKSLAVQKVMGNLSVLEDVPPAAVVADCKSDATVFLVHRDVLTTCRLVGFYNPTKRTIRIFNPHESSKYLIRY